MTHEVACIVEDTRHLEHTFPAAAVQQEMPGRLASGSVDALFGDTLASRGSW
jgi:hypothetical protein